MDRHQGPIGLLGENEQMKLSTFDVSFPGSVSLFQAVWRPGRGELLCRSWDGEAERCGGTGSSRRVCKDRL